VEGWEYAGLVVGAGWASTRLFCFSFVNGSSFVTGMDLKANGGHGLVRRGRSDSRVNRGK